MERPNNDDPCGNCNHMFGIHYESFDGSVTGCTRTFDSQWDGGQCECKGFSIIYRFHNKSNWWTPSQPAGGRSVQLEGQFGAKTWIICRMCKATIEVEGKELKPVPGMPYLCSFNCPACNTYNTVTII